MDLLLVRHGEPDYSDVDKRGYAGHGRDLAKLTEKGVQQAEQAAVDFTLGNTDSTHELTIAQQKAYLSLQYTVAIKNAFLDAYKEIMQIQI